MTQAILLKSALELAAKLLPATSCITLGLLSACLKIGLTAKMTRKRIHKDANAT